MNALCAHAQGFVDLHVESYGVAGPLVETLYNIYRDPTHAPQITSCSHMLTLLVCDPSDAETSTGQDTAPMMRLDNINMKDESMSAGSEKS